VPVRPKPVIISSKINNTPCRSQISRSRGKYSGGGITTPHAAEMGSAMTAATSPRSPNKPAFTAMQVAFKDNTPARDVPQLFYQLRKKISDIKDDLPAGLIGPSINDEYGDVDSILYMITSDGERITTTNLVQ